MAASTWPHWQLQLLKAAGLPTTDANREWLRLWNGYDPTTCERNPVNTTRTAGGATRCKHLPNGEWARAYATRESAALAFGLQLNLTDYPNLRRAFLAGDPRTYKDQAGILLELQEWGSTRWRLQVAALDNIPIGTTDDAGASKAQSNVSGAWTHLHRVLSHEGAKTIAELQRSAAALRRIERRLRRA